jgi:hypothetical protein
MNNNYNHWHEYSLIINKIELSRINQFRIEYSGAK